MLLYFSAVGPFSDCSMDPLRVKDTINKTKVYLKLIKIAQFDSA